MDRRREGRLEREPVPECMLCPDTRRTRTSVPQSVCLWLLASRRPCPCQARRPASITRKLHELLPAVGRTYHKRTRDLPAAALQHECTYTHARSFEHVRKGEIAHLELLLPSIIRGLPCLKLTRSHDNGAGEARVGGVQHLNPVAFRRAASDNILSRLVL